MALGFLIIEWNLHPKATRLLDTIEYVYKDM